MSALGLGRWANFLQGAFNSELFLTFVKRVSECCNIVWPVKESRVSARGGEERNWIMYVHG